MFCIGLNKFRCPSPQRNRTKFPDRSDREASLSPDDPHSSKTADSRRRERAGIHSSPADHAPPETRPCVSPFSAAAQMPRPPLRRRSLPATESGLVRPFADAPGLGIRPPRLCRTGRPQPGKDGQPAAERPDRAVDGNAPFHRNLIVPPATADRRDFGKASRHNTESFPYEPDGKSIRCPENRCAPMQTPPKDRKGNGTAIRLPSNDVLRCGFLSCATTLRNTYLPDSFRTSRNEKPPKEDKTGTGTRPLPSHGRDPETVFRKAETRSYKEQKRQQDKTANPNIQNLASPNGYSHPAAAVLLA